MNRQRYQIFRLIRILIDMLIFMGSFSIGFLDLINNDQVQISLVLLIFGTGAFVHVLVQAIERLYNETLFIKIYDEYSKVMLATFFSTVTVYLCFTGTLSPIQMLMPLLKSALLFLVLQVILLVLNRKIIRTFVHMGLLRNEIVLCGINALSAEYVTTVRENLRFGHIVKHILGKADPRYPELISSGSYDQLGSLLSSNPGISEVVIAIESEEYDQLRGLIEACDKGGVRASIIPDYQRYLTKNLHFDSIGNVLFINTSSTPLDFLLNRTLKRAFDFVFSSMVLVGLSWLYVLLAILVKLSSPGPVFYTQERIGLHNKPFTMIKFRSMRLATGEEAWSSKSEVRITPLGHILRKTSLDEIPQFYNVLKGDMSVVGPRPERPKYVEQFSTEIPKYRLKHRVRPGITGLAQINGYRGDTSVDQRIKYDLYYIENWSFTMDLFVILKTILFGFLSKSES